MKTLHGTPQGSPRGDSQHTGKLESRRLTSLHLFRFKPRACFLSAPPPWQRNPNWSRSWNLGPWERLSRQEQANKKTKIARLIEKAFSFTERTWHQFQLKQPGQSVSSSFLGLTLQRSPRLSAGVGGVQC